MNVFVIIIIIIIIIIIHIVIHIVINIINNNINDDEDDDDDDDDEDFILDQEEQSTDDLEDEFEGNESDEVEILKEDPIEVEDNEEVGINDFEATPLVKSLGQGVDVTKLARAINAALDNGGDTGLAITEAFEIEVTTPGASDELSGIMFQSYRGFDVICLCMDPKTKKQKQIEGKLVERNSQFTVINIKGRMKNLKNQDVLSVKLPKAKKEKGVK